MRVMQAKYNSRVKNQQWNSRTQLNGGPFAIGFTRRGVKQGTLGCPNSKSLEKFCHW